MKREKTPSGLKRFVAGLTVLASCLLGGAALGMLSVKLFIPPGDTGWESLGNALGGLMVGALLGLAAGVVLILRFSVRVQWMASGIAVATACLTFVLFELLAP